MTVLGAHPHFDDLSPLGWGAVGVAILLGLWSLWRAVRFTFEPGETDPRHPKRSILDDGPR